MTQCRLLLSTKPFLSLNPLHYPPFPRPISDPNPLRFSPSPTPLRAAKPPPPTPIAAVKHFAASPAAPTPAARILALICFAALLLGLRLCAAALLPDFPARWRGLGAAAEEAEARTRAYPAHVWQAIVAYEDKRFFAHFGVDPVGVARAAASLSARGGGSTITQQLVKNSFLRNERTLSRKLVEMVLSVALERTLTKWRILSCYVSKIYWGHGIYGIESASKLYFGKHPSLLTLGESALLAGIIPAPELRSPFKNPSRGKIYQARVLKRMVDVGFLDAETALSVLKQPLSYANGSDSVDGLLQLSSFLKEVKCDDEL